MNFPDDTDEVKTERKGQKEIIGRVAFLGSFISGVIMGLIGVYFDELYFVLFGAYLMGASFGTDHFLNLTNRNGKSKVRSIIYVGVITLIGIGLVYLSVANNLF